MKIKNCVKKFSACDHCGSNSPYYDKFNEMYRCWNCGRKVYFKYTPKAKTIQQKD